MSSDDLADGTEQDDEPVSLGMFASWHGKASENTQEWGLQDRETLLFAMQEELGELTQAHLEAEHEGGDRERLSKELDDLGALLLQFHMRLKREARDG